MISKPSLWVLPVCLSFCLSSCSVKEDRRECPVILQLDMSAPGAEGQDIVVSSANEDVRLKQYYYPGLSDAVLSFSLPKGILSVRGVSVLENCHCNETQVWASPGSQYDRLYTYSNFVVANGEYVSETLILHKQYLALDIDLGAILSESDGPFDAMLMGNFAGMDIISGIPLKGNYEAACDMPDTAYYTIRVPRQGDDGLQLKLCRPDADTLTFPVGAMLREAGFDWMAQDLDDARIEIRTLKAGASIAIVDWETGFEKSVEI